MKNTFFQKIKTLLTFLFITQVSACSEAHSVEYYMEHPKEAHSKNNYCNLNFNSSSDCFNAKLALVVSSIKEE